MGGYGWLSYTDNGMTRHPGLDLNSGSGCNDDEGALVVAPLAMIVRAVLYAPSGEGNHVWAEVDDPCCPGPTFLHVDHLQSVYATVGQRLVPGESFGGCGRTGGWDCAHLHTELTKGPPSQGWWMWPYGWSQAQVEAEYWNPHEWWKAATALVYAETAQPPPPEVVETMTDWQLINWVLGPMYEWQGLAGEFNAGSGICKTWVAALRAGHYPGRPRTGERPFGSPQEGVWQECEQQLLVYKSDGEMSWQG
jgi:hypothetical protein